MNTEKIQKHRKLFMHLFKQQILLECFCGSGTISSDDVRYKEYMAWIPRSKELTALTRD